MFKETVNKMYSIYKITDIDTYRVYIGSTKQKLKSVLLNCKSSSRTSSWCNSYDDFNWNNVEIETIEEVEIEDVPKRKRYHIENNGFCVNKWVYGRSKEELKEYNNENIKCECGSVVRRGNLRKHRNQRKHQKFLDIPFLES